MSSEGQAEGPVINLETGKGTGMAFSASGNTLVIHEWKGSGPPYLHVHNEDDEAWHVLEGSLVFRFADREVWAAKGATVFVPAGVPHTYRAEPGSRYLMILTPRLDALIRALQSAPLAQHAAIMEDYKSRIC
jgi:mannose-6-phosphate isomerase-like protein (cupin superfamily)